MRLGNNFPKAGTAIAFRDPLYNEQNSYNIDTGYFTCDVAGVYEFQFHCTINQIAASVDLMRNGELILHSYTTHQNGYVSASGNAFIKLQRGDRVYLVAKHGSNGLTSDSTFSGHLLF